MGMVFARPALWAFHTIWASIHAMETCNDEESKQWHLADSLRHPLNSLGWRLMASIGSHIETALQRV
jgi:hypothetical protein